MLPSFSLLHRISLAVLLLTAMTTHAQSPDLRTKMDETDFKAAGLDKLSDGELAHLEAWLGREVSRQTEQAVSTRTEQAIQQAVAEVRETAREEGRREIVEQNRGFFHFGSDEPITSMINGEFNGFGKGRRYRLGNGQLWEQTDTATLAGVRRIGPTVHIRPGSFGIWWMQIEGYNTRAKVKRIE